MRLFRFPNKKNKTAVMRKQRPRLAANSPFYIKEAYNSIRTKLIFSAKGEKCPVFAVTSSMASDGKTTTAVSLAVSFSMAEQRVLLIDADMRKPSVHRYFSTECRNGLSEFLAGLNKELSFRRTEVDNLTILTAGEIPPNPAELLGTHQMDVLLEYARKHFDYVIIDTPPVNIVTDASILAEKLTGYILVVRSGKNHFRDVGDALQLLEEMKATVAGIVLNDPENQADAHYGHFYRYDKYRYYGEGEAHR